VSEKRSSTMPPRPPGQPGGSDLRVLVVEDEPIAAAAHTSYVQRVPGFTVAATTHTGREALKALATGRVDLVLLDMHLPDGHGLDLVRSMRAAGHPADVIAVTSARDLEVVRGAVSMGVVQYLLKPFVFASLRERLEAYRDYRERTAGQSVVTTQGDVDRVLAGLRAGPSPSASGLPKGLSEEVWGRVVQALRARSDGSPGLRAGASAEEVAVVVGVSRVTARRYLEHLAESSLAVRSLRHLGAGRPVVEYRWAGPT
jgi:response regulator of citrate/malate metabolism